MPLSSPLHHEVRTHKQRTHRYVQTLDLRDDPQLIAQYRQVHSREGIWPEILADIKQAGVLEMDIYLLGTRLVMIVELPADEDWDSVMARIAAGPRQAEWEAFVAQFQRASAEASSSEKWQRMERIFELYR